MTELFAGDVGSLPSDVRGVLVRLLRGPFLDAEREPASWTALDRDEPVIRERLSDLFLVLVIDRVERIAFVQQAEDEGLGFPVLLRRTPLSLVDSALLLFLRQELSSVAGTGQRAVVGRDDITAQLLAYRPESGTDHAGQVKRINGAVTRMLDHRILRTTSTEDRFEISPVLRILLPPERVENLVSAYRDMLTDAGTGADE